jgi:4'-phosphopantetheinyl transferase
MQEPPVLWQIPGRNLALAAKEVHLWLADLDQPEERVRRFAEYLTPEERARADSFRFTRERKQLVVGRGVLRVLLGRYLGLAPAQVPLCQEVHGKPVLAEPWAGWLHFNLSHSGALALYALARDGPLGIDLEQVRPLENVEAIAGQVLTESEKQAWRGLPQEDQLEALFRGWVRKEAYLKAIGVGLTKGLDQVAVSLEPGRSARLLDVDGQPEEASRWSMLSLAPASGYVAAVVTAVPARQVCTWQCSAGCPASGQWWEPPRGLCPAGEPRDSFAG